MSLGPLASLNVASASTNVWIAASSGAPGTQEANITKLVRVLETNGGNLVADAVKWYAQVGACPCWAAQCAVARGRHSMHCSTRLQAMCWHACMYVQRSAQHSWCQLGCLLQSVATASQG